MCERRGGNKTIPSVVMKTSKMRSNQEHVRICREKAGVFHVGQWMGAPVTLLSSLEGSHLSKEWER